MFLWRISQTENGGYDTYDSAIVAAETEEEARLINPDRGGWRGLKGGWCSTPMLVDVELIGTAVDVTEEGIVLASFNAG